MARRAEARAQAGAGAGRGSIVENWGARTPCVGEWPERVDQRLNAAPDRWVQSACVLCSNGSALDIGVKDGRRL